MYAKGSKRKDTGMKRVSYHDHELGAVAFDDGRLILILEDRDTLSPIVDRTSKPVYWKSIRTLTLLRNGAVETVVYGCADCDYVADAIGSVRPHRNAHRKPKPEAATTAVAQVLDLVKAAESAGKMATELAEWKRRALAAEKDLATMKRVLGR